MDYLHLRSTNKHPLLFDQYCYHRRHNHHYNDDDQLRSANKHPPFLVSVIDDIFDHNDDDAFVEMSMVAPPGERVISISEISAPTPYLLRPQGTPQLG